MSLVPVAVTLNSSCLGFIWASQHGYELMKYKSLLKLSFRSSPGSVYPTLQMLEEAVIWPVKEVDGLKRVYTITEVADNS